MPRPTESFLNALRSFDSFLRCRWSTALDCYLIERKVSRGKPLAPLVVANDETVQVLGEELRAEPSPLLRRELDHRIRFMVEEYRAAVEGYVIVLEVPQNCLDERVFFTLWESDIWRRGGAEKVNTEIDERQDAVPRKSRAVWMDEVRGRAKEAFRYMNRVRCVPEKFAHTAPVGGMSVCD